MQQRIVPGQSIGKVTLGMTLKQVRKVLGRPEGIIRRERRSFGREWIEYSWNMTEWRIALYAGRVVRIASSTRAERTREGIGVGTPGRRVERFYSTRCVSGFNVETYFGGGYWCIVKSRGGARTGFRVNGVCKTPIVKGECLGQWPENRRFEVVEVWVFGVGEPLGLSLDERSPMPG